MGRIVALHGFTLDGPAMRAQLGPLGDALAAQGELLVPSAPNACPPDVVARLHARLRPPRGIVAHRMWWRASDDGGVYDGLDASLTLLRGLLAQGGPACLLGFSQGAMMASVVAALRRDGEFPALRSVILIAGAPPRAQSLAPHFESPIELPSLHVKGLNDHLMGDGPERLACHFAAPEFVSFDGGHVVPRRGEASERILDFVQRTL